MLVAPPCLGLAHLESPTADVNTPSRKQKEIGGDHAAHNRLGVMITAGVASTGRAVFAG